MLPLMILDWLTLRGGTRVTLRWTGRQILRISTHRAAMGFNKEKDSEKRRGEDYYHSCNDGRATGGMG